MDYKKKFRKRIYLMAAYVVIGVLIVLSGFMNICRSDVFITIGFALAFSGAFNMIRLLKIYKDEEKLKALGIKETDERNIMIAEKSRSWALAIYIVLCSVAMYFMYATGRDDVGYILAMNVCGLLVIYLICYFIVKRKY